MCETHTLEKNWQQEEFRYINPLEIDMPYTSLL